MVNEQICIRFPNEKHHITLLENRLIFGKFTQYTMLVYILCFMLPKKKKTEWKTYKEQLYIYAEQVHNARTKIKTD